MPGEIIFLSFGSVVPHFLIQISGISILGNPFLKNIGDYVIEVAINVKLGCVFFLKIWIKVVKIKLILREAWNNNSFVIMIIGSISFVHSDHLAKFGNWDAPLWSGFVLNSTRSIFLKILKRVRFRRGVYNINLHILRQISLFGQPAYFAILFLLVLCYHHLIIKY